MRRPNCRPLLALQHGALLAHALPEVLVLPGSAGRHRHHVLQQRRHDPVQERLHQVVRAHGCVQCLRPVDPSQRDGDEGAGQRLPPQVFLLRDVQKPPGPRRPVPLRQRHHLLRARQTQCRPPQRTSAGQPRAVRPKSLLKSHPPRLHPHSIPLPSFLTHSGLVIFSSSPVHALAS